MKEKQNRDRKKEKDTQFTSMAAADFALQDAMEDAGMEPRTYGIWGPIWKLLKKREERELHTLNKKKYILLLIFTGWMGGHRFYARHFWVGGLYLVFFWTLIPVMMSVLDLMQVIPMKSDENGNFEF